MTLDDTPILFTITNKNQAKNNFLDFCYAHPTNWNVKVSSDDHRLLLAIYDGLALLDEQPWHEWTNQIWSIPGPYGYMSLFVLGVHI